MSGMGRSKVFSSLMGRIGLPSFLTALALFSLACSGCDLKMPWMSAPQTAKEEKAAESGDETPDPAAIALALLPPAMRNLPFEEVTFPMPDRLNLYGRLYIPGMKPEGEDDSTGRASPAGEGQADGAVKHPLVVLLHGINRSQSAWGDLPAVLVARGYAVLALDLRGHGKSTRTSSKRAVTWRFFTQNDWQELPKDVSNVLRLMARNEDYPQVDSRRVALVGEKLGANVAVLSAKRSAEVVNALILISPGLDYKGLTPSQAILEFNHPVLLMTSQDDEYANKSTHGLYNWILGEKTLLEYGRIGDGAEILSGKPGIEAALADWLLKALPAASSSIAGELPAQPVENIETATPVKSIPESGKSKESLSEG